MPMKIGGSWVALRLRGLPLPSSAFAYLSKPASSHSSGSSWVTKWSRSCWPQAVTISRQIVAASCDLTTANDRSEEHTSELQSLMRISYAVFCLKKKKTENKTHTK